MTQHKLDNRRCDVVKNRARWQSVDNVPYGQSAEVGCSSALYPADHPYAHSVMAR